MLTTSLGLDRSTWLAAFMVVLGLTLTWSLPSEATLKNGSAFTLSTTTSDEGDPAVAVNSRDGSYLVVWTKTTTDSNGLQINSVMGALVVPQPLGRTITRLTVTADGDHPALAYNSTDNQFLVVYQNSAGIFGRIVSALGTPAKAELPMVATSSTAPASPSIAFDSDRDQYLLAWGNSGNFSVVNGQLLDSDGSAIGSVARISDTLANHPSVVYSASPGNYAVAYDRTLTSVTSNIGVSQVTADSNGISTSAPNPAYTSDATTHRQTSPVAVFNPNSSQFAVFWSDDGGNGGIPDVLVGQRLSTGMATVGGEVAVDYQAVTPAIAYDSSSQKYLASWVVNTNGTGTGGLLKGRFLNTDLTPFGSVFNVSAASVDPTPALAISNGTANGANGLAVWSFPASASQSDLAGQQLDLSKLFSEMTLSVSAPAVARATQAYDYVYTVTNTGPFKAFGVKLTNNALPTTIYNPLSSDSGDCELDSGSNPTLPCIYAIGDLAVGAKVTRTVSVTPQTYGISLSNQATLSWDNQISATSAKSVTAKTKVIFPGTPHLLEPVSGAIIGSGQTSDIRWEVVDAIPGIALKFKLFGSLNNGSSWTLISNDEGITKDDATSTYVYHWAVPTPKGNRGKCLIRVLGYLADTGKTIGRDQTERPPFAIEVIKVTAPNGNESLLANQPFTVTWTLNGTAAPAAQAQLQFSTNRGASWKTIETKSVPSNTTNPQNYTYDWSVPLLAANTDRALFRVSLNDGSNHKIGSDVSDATFSIDALGFVTPASLESVVSAQAYTVRWHLNAPNTAFVSDTLQYRLRGGAWKTLTSLCTEDIANPGDYTCPWQVPKVTRDTRTQLRLTLLDSRNKLVTRTTSGTFLIAP